MIARDSISLRYGVTVAGMTLIFSASGVPAFASPALAFDSGNVSAPSTSSVGSTDVVRRAAERGLTRLSKLRADASKEKGPVAGAIDALAGIAFLEAGNTPDKGDFATDLRACTDSVLSSADDSGLLGNQKVAPMYNHGICTRFLAMQFRATHDPKVKDALTKAVNLIVHSQNAEGGWRYLPISKDSDVSATACQVVALRAAANAGIKVDKAVFEHAAKYICSCQNIDGGFSYMANQRQSGMARSAAAVAALNDAPGVMSQKDFQRALNYLAGFSQKAAPDAHFFYGAFYAAHAFLGAGGESARTEFPSLCDALAAMQKADGSWSGDFSDAYSTASALIALLSHPQPL